MRITFFIILYSFLVLQVARGSEHFQHITINEGLAHSDANCIVQDSSGLIWIGTSAGLQSYDGYTLQTYDYYPEGNRYFQSHNRIYAMSCTSNRIWIGTDNGLTCFDLDKCCYIPYQWKEGIDPKFFNNPITALFVDPSGQFLWIVTRKGMKVFRLRKDVLEPVADPSDNKLELLKGIQNIQFQGNMAWIATYRNLYQMELGENTIKLKHTYNVNELFHAKESIDNIYCLEQYLFIRTTKGCYRFPITNGTLHTSNPDYVEFHAIDTRIPQRTRGHFVVTQDSKLWCAYQEGVFNVENAFSKTPIVHKYLRNTREEKHSAQKIKDLLIDSYDNLWIATSSWGVYYRALSQSFFQNLTREDFEPLGFAQNEIVSITSRDDGTVYLIVEYANLLSYDMHSGLLKHIDIPFIEAYQNLYLQCVRMSRNQRHLYIGTNLGIFIYDTTNQNTQKLQLIQHASIADLQEDNQGRLWVGTWGNGLFCIEHPTNNPTLSLQLDQSTHPSLVSNIINALYLQEGSVFICTNQGINRLYLTENGNIRHLSLYQVDKQLGESSMSSNYIAGMDEVNDSTFWVGTIGGGVNKVVLHSEYDNDYTATCYTRLDGLSSNDCEIVMTDHLGKVWIGSNGLNQLDGDKQQIYAFDYADGLQNNAFKINCFHKMADGTFLIGGLYGLSLFHPESIIDYKKKYSLAFTSLYVNNLYVMPGHTYNGRIVLNHSLDKTTSLTLNHLQNHFTIFFAALGYKLSGQLRYRYRMGHHDEWHVLRHTENYVSFSNLPYGSYDLEVQFSTDMGNSWQSPGKSLAIRILPPWWLSIWAKLASVLLVVGIAIYLFRQYAKEQKLKQENEIQKILIAQDEEKYQAKMRFFMNASHELKTPLTLVLLAVEKLIGQNEPNKEFRSILYNVKQMLAMIAELVDIRKQDLGISSLNLEWVNMSQLLCRMYGDIHLWAEKKHITMTCLTDETDIEMDGDKEKLGKMILNLISNAIKYTNEGGKIDLECKKGSPQDLVPVFSTSHTEGKLADEDVPLCILKVKDTGVGISAESIRLIYERFFQVNGKTQSHLGSGIGLAIVKNVVLQHQGVIMVSSERNKGSEFIIALPIHNTCKRPENTPQAEMDTTTFIQEQYHEFDLSKTDAPETITGTTASENNPDLPTLLIVEDNTELQQVLKEQLSASYNVHIAENGRIGLDLCMSLFPDAIISDVMMPEMDGIEMCKRIKDNLSVASIPIILLTAKDTVESQIEGYESGADLYIAKPFSLKLLEVNLRRLIAQREQWLKKSGEGKNVQTETATSTTQAEQSAQPQEATLQEGMSPEQQKMANRLKAIIQEHLSDSELSPEFLAKELGVSRTKLYRDLKRIDGYSLADYLRNVRLEKAADLLLHSGLNVQEVMFEVGFINSSHFTKIFKMKYGVPPTDYKQGK